MTQFHRGGAVPNKAAPENRASARVTREAAVRFIEGAFRNIDLPALSADDLEDIRDGLEAFARHHGNIDNPSTRGGEGDARQPSPKNA